MVNESKVEQSNSKSDHCLAPFFTGTTVSTHASNADSYLSGTAALPATVLQGFLNRINFSIQINF